MVGRLGISTGANEESGGSGSAVVGRLGISSGAERSEWVSHFGISTGANEESGGSVESSSFF